MRSFVPTISIAAMTIALASCVSQQEGEGVVAEADKSAGVEIAKDEGNPDELLWGDTHLHTEYSMDANTFGVRLTPEDAYRFARGEAVTASNGMTAKLETPLDFLMVADHSDYLGSFTELRAGNPMLIANETLRQWRQMLDLPRKEKLSLEPRQTEPDNPPELDDDGIRGTYWKKVSTRRKNIMIRANSPR